MQADGLVDDHIGTCQVRAEVEAMRARGLVARRNGGPAQPT